jgi:hypothetical protein
MKSLPVYDSLKELRGTGSRPDQSIQAMRRFLIGLTVTMILAVSIGVGVAVALWPRWQH